MFLSARLRLLCFLLLTGLAMLSIALANNAGQGSRVVVFPVQGVIGPATSDYLVKGLENAAQPDVALAIIKLDTPGGLDPSMRAIVQAILASPVPVATFVSPGGARAASAGTFILYASHIAAMTPASNLGAASPVAVGVGGARDPDRGREPLSRDSGRSGSSESSSADQDGGGDASGAADTDRHTRQPAASDDVMSGKVKSDAAAYIRSLAQLRDRNVEFAEQAVTDARSLSAQEALKEGVIEFIARDIPVLLEQLHGQEIPLNDATVITLDTQSAIIDIQEAGWRTKVLSLITNPQLALVLMMIGIYGLFFELTSPGFALPGVAGMICLLLGLYAFHLLPVNWAGVALVFVGTALMIAEVFFPSMGVLGVGGVIAFVLGGLFLTDTGIPAYDLSLPFLIGLAVASSLLLMLAGTLVARAHKQRVVTGTEAMIGLEGRVSLMTDGRIYAQIRGEQWQIVADAPLAVGDRVRVSAVQDLILHVVPVRQTPPTHA